ncbi:hypothetical protein AHF37_08335 [Paragonimus kellicotti]|nr:hypothetical protein AHF37_08335 [Paragonimus kellicotti]
MNIFRLAGDLSHLAAILILLLKIYSSRSCKGLSGKTQVMFALVFTTRYLDLFVYYVSAYNTVMKVLFISLSYLTLYLMCTINSNTPGDNGFAFSVTLFHHTDWWIGLFSEPQNGNFWNRTGQAETITAHYLFALGSYRALYILNWIDRYVTEDVYDLIAIVAGCVQTLLYIDFFYLYVTKVLRGRALVLPV